MTKLILSVSLLILTACGSQLRTPMCDDTLSEFPPEVLGTYKMVLPKPEPVRNAIILSEQEFELRKDGVYLPEYPEIPIPFFGLSSVNVCRISGSLFVQKMNANSTYGLAKLEATSLGLMLNDVTFDYQVMQKLGVPMINIPTLAIYDGVWRNANIISFAGDQYLYDNRKTSPEDLIVHARLTSIRFMFERVAVPKPKKVRILLSEMAKHQPKN